MPKSTKRAFLRTENVEKPRLKKNLQTLKSYLSNQENQISPTVGEIRKQTSIQKTNIILSIMQN